MSDKLETSKDYYPLFEEFPKLASKIKRVAIGDFPTPVQESPELADAVGFGRFFIKRDDKTSSLYGGNKVRKLELILGDAKARKAKTLATFGGIGSNHALATTIHGDSQGFKTVSFLVPQPVTASVKKNILTGHHFGAELRLVDQPQEVPGATFADMALRLFNEGRMPYVVAPGGSSVLGAIGYVNAVFELNDQIEQGLLPEPDRIFVAVGTCGTAAGIALGCKAAGLKTRVTGVKVTDWYFGNRVNYSALATQAAAKLHAIDRTFPLSIMTPADVDLEKDYFGGEYGRYTEEGTEAVGLIKEHAGLQLEGVYTGKALAGAIGAARKEDLSGQTVLFWNTYNSVDISQYAQQHDYTELPEDFQQFFEMPEEG